MMEHGMNPKNLKTNAILAIIASLAWLLAGASAPDCTEDEVAVLVVHDLGDQRGTLHCVHVENLGSN